MTAVHVAEPPRARETPRTGRGRYLPAEPGLWVFILGDMAFFSLFFGLAMWCRAQDPTLYAQSQQLLHVNLAVVNTLVLLTGSFLVARALNTLRRGGRPVALVVATMACAIVFASIKIFEYVDLVGNGYTPSSGDFFMYYFVFTGIHLLHLAIGLGMLTALLVIAIGVGRKRPTRGRRKLAESAAVFWHMVDLLWLVLFPLFYVVH